jgi:hypothetical protein
MMATMNMVVLWDVAPCSLVEVYRRFKDDCCLHRLGDEEVPLRRWVTSTRQHGATSRQQLCSPLTIVISSATINFRFTDLVRFYGCNHKYYRSLVAHVSRNSTVSAAVSFSLHTLAALNSRYVQTTGRF